MENQIKELQCSGCGSNLQHDDSKQLGYIDLKTLEKLQTSERPLLCKRCFKLLNYKEVTPLNINSGDFLEILEKIPSNVTVVAVTDIFDLTPDFFSLLKKLSSTNKFLIVVNKIEDLPRDYKIAAVQDWVRKTAVKENINLQYIVPVSVKTKYNIDILFQILSDEINDDNVYFIGNANVGKSSLINALIKSQEKQITTPAISSLPGTTLNFLTFKNGNQTWYDTPGVLLSNQSLKFLNLDDWQKILPNKRLKPVTFQLLAGQSIFFAGFGWVDFVKGYKTSITFYFNEQVTLHRKKTDLNREFYYNHVGQILKPPASINQSTMDIKLKEQKIETNSKTDVVFGGIGWFTLAKGITVNLTTIEPLEISTRPAII